MEEACPICSRSFPVKFLERHVNSCLDTLEVDTSEQEIQPSSPTATQNGEQKSQDVFAALGLKADSRRPAADKAKKGSATLTSILLAEKRLKRRQEDLEERVRKRHAAQTGPETGGGLHNGQKSTVTEIPATPASPHARDLDPGTKPEQRWKHEFMRLKREADLPLAQRLRPKSLGDFYGQEKLVGENGILRNLVAASQIPSFILWGVPGVGKTSLARIISLTCNHKFMELSGSDSNAKKLKEAFAAAQHEKLLTGQKTILFLDEIHRFNKAVQDLLLPVIENGTVTVIGATTENPSFSLNNALLSRMHTFVMEPLPHEALVKILNKGLLLLNRTRKIVHGLHLIAMNKDSVDYIASLSSGDSRVALNILESVNAYLSGLQFKAFPEKDPEREKFDLLPQIGVVQVTLDKLKPLLSTRNFHQMYDKTGDNHYDTISAFHKSVRGSNADAAVFYLVKMLRGGEDPLFIARRMIVIASEDVGLRDSSCLPFAIATMEAIQFVGMPEGEIILAHCAVKLARAPKSTKSYRALRKAQGLLSDDPEICKLPIPIHLRNAPTKLMKDLGYGDTYKYNPNFKHGMVKQEYFPPEIRDACFVDDTHLGTAMDEEVRPEEYAGADEEANDYQRFKDTRRQELARKLVGRKELAKLQKVSDRLGLLSSPVERLASYDENLSKEVQPEYFDGTDHVSEADEADYDIADCTYDEFMKGI
ncbi:P-loop containing nucleoside triphosphate hydrolase protein [Metschnikowia bicuspidata var. bicuspidata NRRL YB-4993]|uniref:p-loop containing nucleoside triphosphate hydrolase protein n=1 Tax=Metschnikowia bicuspidata var. bicuspidata NRRL YB-4993 TaxID=869754 RepID=A0A1A0HG48_9ASCO|nr:P-loop containing nucleoside triphosphate hydrolase protein [Metschnikowia bicuspidata var. bicuspidata NRRL YB-4993]OBA22960.1 P-loop containing nucleoside triphosphate hydrolase protein [Metschnikowia bicuspidata var. bicuspidata NRRL YB-4993]